MLVLTRRIGENIMIGDDICVRILSEQSGQVKVGIDAPRDISVHREEIYKRIQKDKKNG